MNEIQLIVLSLIHLIYMCGSSLFYFFFKHSTQVSSIGVKQAAARFRVMIEKHLDAEVDEKAARQLFEMVAKAFSTTTTSTSLKLTMPQDIEVPSCKGISNSSIIIPSDMRFKCLSSLLTGSDTDEDDPSQQEILIDEAGGASGILLETLKCCNHDVRGLVSLNIIICGGDQQFLIWQKQFAWRLQKQHSHMKN